MALIRYRADEDLEACIAVLARVHEVNKYPISGLANPRLFMTSKATEQSWVAELDGQVVGHVAVSTATEDDIACKLWWSSHPGDRIATLSRLFVDPVRRGSGIAATLVNTATAWARQHGLRLILFTLDKDVAARKLYGNVGWAHFGDGTFNYGDGQQMRALCFASPMEANKTEPAT